MTLVENARENLAKSFEKWHSNKVDETRLSSGHVYGATIAKHTNWKVYLLFQVTLGKEFLEEQISPILTSLERPGCLGHITGVETAFQYELLVLESQLLVFLLENGDS